MLTILDPTSLVGRDLLERLAREWSRWRPSLFHTDASSEHLIAEIAGEAALVPPLQDLDELEASTTVVVTVTPPVPVATRLLAWLRAHPRVNLIDASQPGVAGAEACLTIGTPPPHAPRPWYRLPDPALAPPARWLAALAPLVPTIAHLTILSPAAGFGAEALEELAAQGAARLSGGAEVPTAHLPAALAFDLAPAGPERARVLESDLLELFPRLAARVQLVDAGVFHGHLATAVATCTVTPTVARVRGLLRADPGFRLLRRGETTSVCTAVARGGIACGGLEVRGHEVSAWLCADGARVGTADAAVELLASLSAM